jgi:hypothetical protein
VEECLDGMRLVPHDPREDVELFVASLQRLLRLNTIGKHEMTSRPMSCVLSHPTELAG